MHSDVNETVGAPILTNHSGNDNTVSDALHRDKWGHPPPATTAINYPPPRGTERRTHYAWRHLFLFQILSAHHVPRDALDTWESAVAKTLAPDLQGAYNKGSVKMWRRQKEVLKRGGGGIWPTGYARQRLKTFWLSRLGRWDATGT